MLCKAAAPTGSAAVPRRISTATRSKPAMVVFHSGTTGSIGSRATRALVAAGHAVRGLTRSDEGACSLAAAGAEPHRGTIEDLDNLRAGATSVDGAIRTAFDQNMTDFAA